MRECMRFFFLKKGFPRDDRPELQRPPRGRREGLQGPPVAGHSKGEAIIDSPYHNNSILNLFCCIAERQQHLPPPLLCVPQLALSRGTKVP